MATLIPQIRLSDFKSLRVDQIRRLKSCEVYADGEYLFTFINPQTEYIRTQSEYTAQLGNAVGGQTLAEILEEVLVK